MDYVTATLRLRQLVAVPRICLVASKPREDKNIQRSKDKEQHSEAKEDYLQRSHAERLHVRHLQEEKYITGKMSPWREKPEISCFTHICTDLSLKLVIKKKSKTLGLDQRKDVLELVCIQ